MKPESRLALTGLTIAFPPVLERLLNAVEGARS